MSATTVTVFGASGFLGRAVVERLAGAGLSVRAAARRPERGGAATFGERVEPRPADVRDAASVAAAVEGAGAVVNAVGLYLESGSETFEAVHVRGAATVAEAAASAGVERLVHVSGIGADPGSPSKYVRARAEGERLVRQRFESAAILRPSVLFGPGDAFLSAIDAVSRLAPVFPLFGRGLTRLQPVYLGDVAEAILRCVEGAAAGRECELGGPRIYTYRQVVELILAHRGRRRLLLPFPFALWTAQARVLSLLPSPPLTEDQVILMRGDNVVGEGMLTLEDLDVSPRALEALLPRCLTADRP